MTDTKQHEALMLADELEVGIPFAPNIVQNERALRERSAAELRRLRAENTTLQQGYDAARLEIESLKARLEPAGEYPPLPDGVPAGKLSASAIAYSAAQLRAYVDADRAMRAQAAYGDGLPKTQEELDFMLHVARIDGWHSALGKVAQAKERRAQAAPAAVAVPSEEREAFEAWYCDQMAKAGYGPDCTIHDLREENHYGEHRVMLNGKWEGWQARAALAALAAAAAPQPPVAAQKEFDADDMQQQWEAAFKAGMNAAAPAAVAVPLVGPLASLPQHVQECVIAYGDARAAQVAPQPPVAAQEQVAWRTFDGEGGYDYRSYEGNENYAQEWANRNPNHKDWVEPLFLPAQQPAPVAQGDAEDAARYRYLRDGDWREREDLEPVVRLQLNTLWDEKIDAARAQAKEEASHD